MKAFLFLMILPLVEISLFVMIGSKIGVLGVLLFIFSSGFLGVYLLRRASFNFMYSLENNFQEGSAFDPLIFSNFCAYLGAILLIIPGFFTSFIGILLYIPELQKWLLTKEKLLNFKNYVFSFKNKNANKNTASQPHKKIIEVDYIEINEINEIDENEGKK